MKRSWAFVLAGVMLFSMHPWALHAATEVRVQILPLQLFSAERDAEELRTLIERVISARLQSEEGLRVAHRPEQRAPAEGYTEEQVRREGEMTGAGWVLWGSLTQAGRLFSLDLQLLAVGAVSPAMPVAVQGSSREELIGATEGEMEKLLSRILRRQKVVEVRVEGNRRIGKDAVLLRAKTRIGDDYSSNRLQADVREIEKMGYFEDVQARAEDATGGKAVVFVVKEKPIIREVVITGNDKIDTDKIREVITLQPQSILNYQSLKDTVEKIKKLYQEKGFYGAEVSYDLKDLEGNQKGVIFQVQEGKKFWVRKISFQGNNHFTDKELKRVMKTQEKDWLYWFNDSGVLDQETLKQDAERIADFYYNQGYLKNKVGMPHIETDQESMFITLGIEEGEIYTVRSIELAGDLLDPAETMKGSLNIKEGKNFSRESLRKDIQVLSERYSDQGYAYVEIKPQTKVQDDSRTVDIKLQIQQKQKVHIGRIRIMGNTKTRDKVIRREIQLSEGDTFSSTALKASNERLKSLKFFEEVNITSTPGATPEVVDLNVEVKEQQTGSFSIGAGYSSAEEFVGIAEIQQTNLFGRGYKVRLKAEVGSKRQFYTFTFLDPYLLDTRTAMRIDAYNTDRIYLDFTRRSMGGSLMFSHPLDRFLKRLTGTIGYRIEDVEVTDVDAGSAFILQASEGRHLTSSVIGGLVYDTRDHHLYPRRGNLSNFTTEFAGLGGDKFGKFVMNSAQYFPVKWDTVFMVRGEFGYGYGWGGDELPVYERFFLGGINTIRGFKPGAVGQRDPLTGDIIGGDKEIFFNFEYIFPIVKKLELRGVLFYDTGNAFLDAVDLGKFRHTAGVGLRWFSPLGPLRVELGYNLRPEADEKRIEWAFGMGGSF